MVNLKQPRKENDSCDKSGSSLDISTPASKDELQIIGAAIGAALAEARKKSIANQRRVDKMNCKPPRLI